MWRIEEEQLKEEKALHMTSHEESQRKEILNLKERKIVRTMQNLVIWREIVGLKKINKETEVMMIVRKLMLQVMIYKML